MEVFGEKGHEGGLEKGCTNGKGWAEGWQKGWGAEGWEKGVQRELEKALDGSRKGKGCVKGWEKGPNGIGHGWKSGGKSWRMEWEKGADGNGAGRELGCDQDGKNWQMTWTESEFGYRGFETGWDLQWDGKGKGFEKGFVGEELDGKGKFWICDSGPQPPVSFDGPKIFAPLTFGDVDSELADFEKKVEDGKGWDEGKTHGQDENGKHAWDKGWVNGVGFTKATNADGGEQKADWTSEMPEAERNKIWEHAWEDKAVDWDKAWEPTGPAWNWVRPDRADYW